MYLNLKSYIRDTHLQHQDGEGGNACVFLYTELSNVFKPQILHTGYTPATPGWRRRECVQFSACKRDFQHWFFLFLFCFESFLFQVILFLFCFVLKKTGWRRSECVQFSACKSDCLVFNNFRFFNFSLLFVCTIFCVQKELSGFLLTTRSLFRV